ncbi:MAG TPA: D-hexose-6-phosphate mutarotase [Burkholderiales bacterium]|nr:D-hexose-6-phosphate mutarotase [Burkholderiales bacterium]
MTPKTSPPSDAGAELAPVAGAEGQRKVVLVAADGARAEVYLHGAQVTSWVPAGDTSDRLFLSARSRYKPGAAIRGGVPVCFPQFATQGPLPSHGFARVSTWDLTRGERRDSGTAHAVLRLTDSDATRAVWPHAFVAQLSIKVNGRELEIGLIVENSGSTLFEFTGALHTYLRVADIRQTVVRGLRNARYRDKVLGTDGVIETASELRIDRELDRVYYTAPDALEVHEPGRTTAIRATGFPETVVWNPGERGGAALEDLEPGGYARMVCVEAAVARAPAALSAGESWSGTQKLTAR